VLSLANKLWRYGYWTLYQCLPVRNVPTELSLYNYKLSGVTDGNLSFAASSMHREEAPEIELSEKATQEVSAPQGWLFRTLRGLYRAVLALCMRNRLMIEVAVEVTPLLCHV